MPCFPTTHSDSDYDSDSVAAHWFKYMGSHSGGTITFDAGDSTYSCHNGDGILNLA